jgi:hypothetical protein
MDHWRNHRRSSGGVCLLVSVSICCALPSWAGGATQSRPASSRRASQPAQPIVSLPDQATTTDPCAPSAPTMETKAAPEPSRHTTSALASFVTRARSQKGTPATEAKDNGPLALDLWSSRISAPEAVNDVETSLALKRLIRQVHSLTLHEKTPAQPPAPTAEPSPAAKLLAPTSADSKSVKPAEKEAVVPETTPGLSPKAQRTLDDLRKNPSRVQDPLEAAELLFLSGRPTDAVPFYEEALRRTRAGDAASGSDRAWVLFQLGNCLRETDAAKAQDAYTKLIAEYPNSPWTEMARATGRLLTWQQSTRPDQLTATRKP